MNPTRRGFVRGAWVTALCGGLGCKRASDRFQGPQQRGDDAVWDEQIGPLDLRVPVRIVALDAGPYPERLAAAVDADPVGKEEGVLVIRARRWRDAPAVVGVALRHELEEPPPLRSYLEQLFARQPDLRLPSGRELILAPGVHNFETASGLQVEDTWEATVALVDDALTLTQARAVRVGFDDLRLHHYVDVETIPTDAGAVAEYSKRHAGQHLRIIVGDRVSKPLWAREDLEAGRVRINLTKGWLDAASETHPKLFERLTGRPMTPLSLDALKGL